MMNQLIVPVLKSSALSEDQIKVWRSAYDEAIEKNQDPTQAAKSAWAVFKTAPPSHKEAFMQYRSKLLDMAGQHADMGSEGTLMSLLKSASEIVHLTDVEIKTYQERIRAAREKRIPAPAITNRRFFSDEAREKLAKGGEALPDGSFPITDESDLKNAIQAIGRAKNPTRARKHIKQRAASLGLSDLIPVTWKSAIQERTDGESEWYLDRLSVRMFEATRDFELINRYGADLQIDRPDYHDSINWDSKSVAERTLGAEVRRRQIIRNYHERADQMMLQGWKAFPIQGNTKGDHEFQAYGFGESGEKVLMRAILVRKEDQTDFFPRIMSGPLAGSISTLVPGEVRL